jgi:hypothetical protein
MYYWIYSSKKKHSSFPKIDKYSINLWFDRVHFYTINNRIHTPEAALVDLTTRWWDEDRTAQCDYRSPHIIAHHSWDVSHSDPLTAAQPKSAPRWVGTSPGNQCCALWLIVIIIQIQSGPVYSNGWAGASLLCHVCLYYYCTTWRCWVSVWIAVDSGSEKFYFRCSATV